MRSRAVSLPAWCCFSMRSLTPPSLRRARVSSKSLILASIPILICSATGIFILQMWGRLSACGGLSGRPFRRQFAAFCYVAQLWRAGSPPQAKGLPHNSSRRRSHGNVMRLTIQGHDIRHRLRQLALRRRGRRFRGGLGGRFSRLFTQILRSLAARREELRRHSREHGVSQNVFVAAVASVQRQSIGAQLVPLGTQQIRRTPGDGLLLGVLESLLDYLRVLLAEGTPVITQHQVGEFAGHYFVASH